MKITITNYKLPWRKPDIYIDLQKDENYITIDGCHNCRIKSKKQTLEK